MCLYHEPVPCALHQIWDPSCYWEVTRVKLKTGEVSLKHLAAAP